MGSRIATIGDFAFASCSSLLRIILPQSLLHLGAGAFSSCSALSAVLFDGDAPSVGSGAFNLAANATVYFYPDTLGWPSPPDPWSGPPTALRPALIADDGTLGVSGPTFGFSVARASGSFVVESAAAPTDPLWIPLQTNSVSGPAQFVSVPLPTNQFRRFYRIRMLP